MGIILGIPYWIIDINGDWVRKNWEKIISNTKGNEMGHHRFCCIQRLQNNLTDNLWAWLRPHCGLQQQDDRGELKKIAFIPVVDESPGGWHKVIPFSRSGRVQSATEQALQWLPSAWLASAWTLEVHLCVSILCLIEGGVLWKRKAVEDKCNENVIKSCCQLRYSLQWPFKSFPSSNTLILYFATSFCRNKCKQVMKKAATRLTSNII